MAGEILDLHRFRHATMAISGRLPRPNAADWIQKVLEDHVLTAPDAVVSVTLRPSHAVVVSPPSASTTKQRRSSVRVDDHEISPLMFEAVVKLRLTQRTVHQQILENYLLKQYLQTVVFFPGSFEFNYPGDIVISYDDQPRQAALLKLQRLHRKRALSSQETDTPILKQARPFAHHVVPCK